ncbi:FIST N-terminal domain-containing protein [Nannocystis pusilla]|uniref:FIST N-terminal domain-containing protein n=1 Tax=Nannocystis pusilla TaxID=889268 RepID=UPI003B8092E9
MSASSERDQEALHAAVRARPPATTRLVGATTAGEIDHERMPTVGVVDEERAAAISSRTLEEVTATGDARTAAHVVALARAVYLLGTRCIACGLHPAVAGAMVTLGLESTALAATRGWREILRARAASRAQSKPRSA